MELPSPPPPSPGGATDTDMTPDREYVTPSEESLSSGEDADIDKKGNPISVDNTNAISLPSDDPIGLAEFLNKGDVTSLDSQSNDATDGATVAAAAAVDTVAHTVSFADAVADATSEGDAASGSDSATDGVDSTAALISTTTDANGAVSESTVATNDITVNEPTTSTTTTSIVTTTDTSAPRTSVEEAIIATTENVVVSNTIVFAQDTVHFNETVAHVIAVKITSVDVIESPPVIPAEDAAASETPSVTTVGTVAETTTAALLAQDTFNILSDSVVDDEPAAKEEIAPQLPATVTDTTAESTLEVEPKAAVQKSKAAREEKKTQLPSHSSIDTPINTCSYVYSKGRRQCSKGVLTVSSGPYFCQIHRRHGSHGGFIYYNEHISVLLVKDFKVLAERYPGKRRKLRAKIKEHFKMLFKDPERNLRGLSRTITDERTFKCDNPKCKVQNHEEVYALPLNGKSREVAFESYQKEIVANMEVWLPFLRSLADGPLIYALCKTLDPSYGV
ncbi:MAG: hypothetical protein JOS17DRAFT_787979 [Linnemannia elongata]|nr:MAG: hypothetical protein JOS17DRAFT_787979 [Linnemannia elongata]